VQLTVSILRSALPFVQRLLPLLEGNIVSAITGLLAPRVQPQTPQPSVKLDLEPIEDGVTELRSQQRSLSIQMTEQNTSLQRVENQLEMMREATDRNTLEHQKVKSIAIVALVLAAVGFIITLALFLTLGLFLHMNKRLP